MVKRWEICNQKYIPKAPNQKSCSNECSKQASRSLQNEQKRSVKQRKKKHINTQPELIRLANEAAAHGMTYGKYIEWLENQKKVGGNDG